MQLFAARIALLAYLVGGLAIPAMHQHGLVHHATGHSHAGHSHEGHSHAGHSHAGHSHEVPASSAKSDTRDSCCSSAADGETTLAAASIAAAPHEATCGEDCVICVFTGSAQAFLADVPPLLLGVPQARIAAAAQGPGFTAADLRADRLRGPPRGVILV